MYMLIRWAQVSPPHAITLLVTRATRLEQCCQRFGIIMSQKDAPWLFLSMRIKRLLKFIDITDSIKLCQAANTLELTMACLYTYIYTCISYFFFLCLPLYSFLFLCCIFFEWRGNGSEFTMSSTAATDDWQQNWQCQKQQHWRCVATSTSTATLEENVSAAFAVREANSICMKNTFSCRTCYKYNYNNNNNYNNHNCNSIDSVSCTFYYCYFKQKF